MNSLADLVDLHKCYEVLKEENVIFSHKGALDGDMIDVIIQLADKKLVKAKTRVRTKKKIINILIECLQNSFHYTSAYLKENYVAEEALNSPSEANQQENNQETVPVIDTEQWTELIESPFMVLSQKENIYFIMTGNYITHEKAEILKKRIDEITALNDEELQDYYIKSLDKDELPKQGGAGLGLIDIIRRSKHNVSFEFKEVDENYQRFNLLIKVE